MNLQTLIEKKIIQSISPDFINVENESMNHAVPKNSETHFKVTVISELFSTMPLLKRHRQINKLLEVELEGPIHALAIHAYTNAEWLEKNKMIPDTAKCLGKRK